MSRIEQSIEVDAPLREVYNQWTQFEEFPRFMDGVESVTQVGDTHLHWVANVGGKREEWDAEIIEQVADQRIAWSSTSGSSNAGSVTFRPVDAARTQITLAMEIAPQGAVEQVGDALGVPDRRVRGDLERFKSFIEARGVATGGWRGEVEGGRVEDAGIPGHDRELAGTGAGSMRTSGMGDDDLADLTPGPTGMGTGMGSGAGADDGLDGASGLGTTGGRKDTGL